MRNSILVLDYLLEAMEMDGKQSTTDLQKLLNYWTPKWMEMDNYQNLQKITMKFTQNSHIEKTINFSGSNYQ